MATNAQDVFEKAMSLMDELSDSGVADTADTKEYKDRTLAILNILGGELYPYSDNYEVGEVGKRPIFTPITSFTGDPDDPEDDGAIALDDYCCRTVMPYGLVAHLLIDENPSVAAFCQQRYEELKARLAEGLPRESEDIFDVYGFCGGIEPYNEFGMWR